MSRGRLASPGRLRVASRGRLADERGSMPLALLVTVVGVALSAVLVPMVVNQIGTTRTGIQRSHALGAAQAGLNVALGQIQAAVDDDGSGARDALPCGPVTGLVGAGGAARYQVSIDYLAADPQGQSDAWVAANALACTTGVGPASTPAYALLRAEGTDSATGAFGSIPSRKLRATYTFRTTNQRTAGGLIRIYKTPASTDLCLDAGSGNPATGTNVRLQPCSPGNVRQSFAYQPNLTIVLVSSMTAARPRGMCLDAATAHIVGRVVQLRPCAATTSLRQQWMYNASGNFEGVTNATAPDGFCFNAQSPDTQGSLVVLGSAATSTCRGGYDTVQTFTPEAAVGTGPAGAYGGQLANLGQFSRCVEVTNANVDHAYLTAQPCQHANTSWVQRWSLPTIAAGDDSATGPITTTAVPGGDYCLRSPGTTAPGSYVTVAACPAGGATPLDMRWTVYADTGSYVSGYRVVDSYGLCLAPTDSTDLHPSGYQVSKLVVSACGGSALQKWNAPPYALQVLPVKDVTET